MTKKPAHTLGEKLLMRGEKVRLTAMTEADLPTLAEWHSDELFQRLGSLRPATPSHIDGLRSAFVAESPTRIAFGVRTLLGDRLVGYVTLRIPFWVHRWAELGLGIGPEADRGQGYGTETMRLILRFGFNELNLHRIALGVFEYNTRAYQLYKRIGFVEEGRQRDFLRRNGVWYDDIQMSILEHEWEAIEAGSQ